MSVRLPARVGLALMCTLLAFAITGCAAKTPSVEGLSVADARKSIDRAGLHVGDVQYIASQGVPVGTVVVQVPQSGSEIEEGGSVDLSVVVSDGASMLVPDLTGMSKAEVLEIQRVVGTEVTFAKAASEKVEFDTVCEQLPEAGAVVKMGEPILAVISLGPSADERLEVPEVLGEDSDAASAEIVDVGFAPEVITVSDPTAAAGVVITQLPRAGAKRLRGSAIKLIVSAGWNGEGSALSDVATMTAAAARVTLEDAGYEVMVLERNSDTVAKGSVVEQYPSPGTQVPKNSLVVLMVSKGKAASYVEVPYVERMRVGDAREELAAAGLKMRVWPSDLHADSFDIARQFPEVGTSLAKGSKVIVVYDEDL